jgi:hypothetical protein
MKRYKGGVRRKVGGGFLRQFKRNRFSNFVTVINKVYTTTPYQPHPPQRGK